MILKKYFISKTEIDSVELKCMVVSRSVKVANEVYKKYTKISRLGKKPLMCNCFIL